MKRYIRNYDENGKYHGIQINYYDNENISWIQNNNHGNYHGYSAHFNPDTSIVYKQYYNMNKLIYKEDYLWSKQIRIKI